MRSAIVDSLRNLKTFQVFEEDVQCISTEGSIKRADIVAIDQQHKMGYILNSTVRFESDATQAKEVHEEKQKHCQPCVKILVSNMTFIIGKL